MANESKEQLIARLRASIFRKLDKMSILRADTGDEVRNMDRYTKATAIGEHHALEWVLKLLETAEEDESDKELDECTTHQLSVE